MSHQVKDKFGYEVFEGDTIIFPYIDPMGNPSLEPDFETKVVYKYGCLGYETKTKFIPLMNWMKTEEGKYIPNEGNKIIYTEKYLFWLKK